MLVFPFFFFFRRRLRFSSEVLQFRFHTRKASDQQPANCQPAEAMDGAAGVEKRLVPDRRFEITSNPRFGHEPCVVEAAQGQAKVEVSNRRHPMGDHSEILDIRQGQLPTADAELGQGRRRDPQQRQQQQQQPVKSRRRPVVTTGIGGGGCRPVRFGADAGGDARYRPVVIDHGEVAQDQVRERVRAQAKSAEGNVCRDMGVYTSNHAGDVRSQNNSTQQTSAARRQSDPE